MIIPLKPVPFEGSVLVTGSTGTVGRHVVQELLKAGVRVRAAVHSHEKGAVLKSLGAKVVEMDYAKPATVHSAFTHVDRLFILTPVDSKMVHYTEQLVREAQRAGVKHIVKLSVVGASTKSFLTLAKWHGEAETVVSNSGIPFAIIRPTMFMQNFVTMFGPSISKDDTIFAAAGEGRVPFVDARDVARVVSKVIVERQTDRIYTLTGSEQMTFYDAAKALSKQLGREIEYVAISQEGAKSGMDGMEMPPWMVSAFLELWSSVRSGNLSVMSSDYKMVMGRAPVLFKDFVRDYKEKWK